MELHPGVRAVKIPKIQEFSRKSALFQTGSKTRWKTVTSINPFTRTTPVIIDLRNVLSIVIIVCFKRQSEDLIRIRNAVCYNEINLAAQCNLKMAGFVTTGKISIVIGYKIDFFKKP